MKYEVSAQKQALRALKAYQLAVERVVELEDTLHKLGPHTREAYLRLEIPTPEIAAQQVLNCLQMPNGTITGLRWTFAAPVLNLPDTATFAQVANLIVEYVAYRGWKEKFQKLLNENVKLALSDIANPENETVRDDLRGAA